MIDICTDSFDEIRALAHEALLQIFDDPYRRDRFFALTGTTTQQIRAEMNRLEFVAGVFDYILGDEVFLKNFADSQNLDPAAITLARSRLPDAPMSQ